MCTVCQYSVWAGLWGCVSVCVRVGGCMCAYKTSSDTCILQLQVDLDTDTAVVFGHGNVALDLARMLLTPLDILAVSGLVHFTCFLGKP